MQKSKSFNLLALGTSRTHRVGNNLARELPKEKLELKIIQQ